MAKLDIREATRPIDEIIFANDVGGFAHAHTLRISPSNRIHIHGRGDYLYVDGKTEAEHLIKALKKAIELEWVK